MIRNVVEEGISLEQTLNLYRVLAEDNNVFRYIDVTLTVILSDLAVYRRCSSSGVQSGLFSGLGEPWVISWLFSTSPLMTRVLWPRHGTDGPPRRDARIRSRFLTWLPFCWPAAGGALPFTFPPTELCTLPASTFKNVRTTWKRVRWENTEEADANTSIGSVSSCHEHDGAAFWKTRAHYWSTNTLDIPPPKPPPTSRRNRALDNLVAGEKRKRPESRGGIFKNMPFREKLEVGISLWRSRRGARED